MPKQDLSPLKPRNKHARPKADYGTLMFSLSLYLDLHKRLDPKLNMPNNKTWLIYCPGPRMTSLKA